jgi:membrane associated rhomboid family serine protease
MASTIDPFWWECIRRDVEPRLIEEARLVLTAVDVDFRIHFEDGHWCLYVPRGLGAEATAHLERYRAENVDARPSLPIERPPVDSGFAGAVAYVFAIWLVPTLEAWASFGARLRDVGPLDAALVRTGEWWRTVTALTLHADIGHLIGNSVFGAVLGVLVARRLGSGVGWLAIVVAAALGNALDAIVQRDGFVSLGASTAAFAALGIAATAGVRADASRGDWRRHLAPIAGAIGLLAFTGLEGERTDIVAHVCGFLVGIAVGALCARIPPRWLGPAAQRRAGLAAIAVALGCWTIALRA